MFIVSKHMKEQRWRAPRASAITKVDTEKVKQAARVAELIKTLRPQIKSEFTEAIKKVGDYIDYAEIARKLAEGDVAGAIEEVNKKLIESGFFGFANRLTHAAIRAGVDEAKAIAGQAAGPAELRVVFNVTNPHTIAHLRTYEMDKIQQMSSEALASVRRAVLDGVHAGRNPLDIAREVKNYIGLTERQTAAVLNYRRMLENQNTDALTRALRDRRFDPTVTNAFSNAQALSQEQVNRMVDRYQERYLAYRAETISRTEAMRAVNNGSFMAWQQAVNEGSIDADTVVREWIYTHDDKTRDAHRAIPDMNPDGVGIDEPFDTPLGPLMYPGDPDGLPENTINCRCTVISRVVPKIEKVGPPDEPRDESGKWTDSGGGAGEGASPLMRNNNEGGEIAENIRSDMVTRYNEKLPSIESQFHRFAGKDSSYEEYNAKRAVETFGPREDWPEGLGKILDAHGAAVEIIENQHRPAEYFAPDQAISREQFMREAVERAGGILPASDLGDIMRGLETRVDIEEGSAEVAASYAFKVMARALGWQPSHGVRYFTVKRGGNELNVRISDHGNLTRSNPNAVTPDINIAPGAHDFDDAAKILSKLGIKKYNENHDELGRFATGGSGSSGGGSSGDAETFISPNIRELDFAGARREMTGARQSQLRQLNQEIDGEAGLHGENVDVLGAWKDGAENSIMTTVHNADYETVRVAAAMKGYLANQKSVLVFHHGEGSDYLAQFEARGSLESIHDRLLNEGLSFHTLVPTANGARVVIFGSDQETISAVERASRSYGTNYKITPGKGELIGTSAEGLGDQESRADARRVYSQIISMAASGRGQASNLARKWDDYRDRWGAILKAIAEWIVLEKFWKYDPNQPRVPAGNPDGGRWSGGGSGESTTGVQATGDISEKKQEWINESQWSNIDRVVARAPIDQAIYAKAGKKIAAELGVKFKNPGVKTKTQKGIDRALDKARDRRGLAGVTDIVRGGFEITSPEQSDSIIKALGKRFQTLGEDWNITPLGYMDRVALIRFRSGMIGEVQMIEPKMSWAKSPEGGGGHDLYSKWRKLDPRSPQALELVEQQRQLYGGVIKSYRGKWAKTAKAAMARARQDREP